MGTIIMGIIILIIGYGIMAIRKYWPIILLFFVLAIVLGIIIAIRTRKRNEEIFNSVDLSAVDVMSGLEFEQYVAKLLAHSGYTNVSVTKASGDYGVDVFAKTAGKQYAFQCKRYNGKLGVKCVQEIYSGANMYHAEIPVVITNSYFTANAIKLAKELNVQLWDRNKLFQLIKRHSAAEEEFSQNAFVMQAKNAISKSNQNNSSRSVPQPSAVEDTPFASRIEQYNARFAQKNCDYDSLAKYYKSEELIDMSTVLGAGTYTFGRNIPAGTYDLTAISGRGYLTPFDLEGDELSMIRFGADDENYAKEYHGLNSDDFKKFVVEGNVKFEIKRSRMIVID